MMPLCSGSRGFKTITLVPSTPRNPWQSNVSSVFPPRHQMSSTTQQVAYLRDRLMKKGTIYVEPDGRLHFITPGMAEWALTEHV